MDSKTNATPEKAPRPATEQDPKSVELSVEELEERIAPRKRGTK